MATIDATKPPDGVTVQAELRNNFSAIKGRIEPLPDSLDSGGNQCTALVGRAVVIGASGAKAVENSDTVSFGNALLRAGRVYRVTVTGNTTLTDAAHGGAEVVVDSTSDVTITADGSQISDGFVCVVRRQGVGEVAIAVSGGLALRQEDGHTRVNGRYGAVAISRRGNDVYADGRMKP